MTFQKGDAVVDVRPEPLGLEKGVGVVEDLWPTPGSAEADQLNIPSVGVRWPDGRLNYHYPEHLAPKAEHELIQAVGGPL